MPTLEECLFRAFFEFGNVDHLDNPSKAALRLCNKKIKAWIDATVTACKIKPDAVDALLRCDWHFLTELELQRAECSEIKIPSALISKFPTLEKLTVHTLPKSLVSLPASIGELSHLKVFEVDFARGITALPPSFGQLTKLERLTLPHGDSLTMEGLAPIKELKQPRHLNVGGRLLCGPLFPEWICSCKFILLEALCLHDYKGPFSSSICTTFKHLTSLEIYGQDDLEVPESISSLYALQKLVVYIYDKPISLPELCSKLTTLKELAMVANMNGIAPLQHLTGLTKLNLHAPYYNSFENYPDFIWNLTSLRELELACGCNVRSLPEDAFNKLINLMDLRLYGFDSLQELPPSIGNLSSLTTLHLIEFNILHSLPDSIGNFKNLISLVLGDLRILAMLPSTLGNLEALQNLVLHRCDLLTELPETIGNLHALQELNVTNRNKRFRIPDSFSDLVFGTASENTTSLRTALTKVMFRYPYRSEISDRGMKALHLLKEHGIYKHINY